jgi:hypothetical protein
MKMPGKCHYDAIFASFRCALFCATFEVEGANGKIVCGFSGRGV